jgi:hypothetical protein
MQTFLRPILFLVLILLSVSLACSYITGGTTDVPATESAANENLPLELPTARPTAVIEPPTAKPALVQPTLEAPTLEVPAAGPQRFFKEEFDANTNFDNWSYFTTGPGGDDSNLIIEQKGEGLNFDLGALDLYVYYLYEGQTYDDVALTLVAENQGVNNNNVSLVCRLDYDNSEWYEFSFESGGVWFLYAYQNGYNTIDNGGSNALKQGRAVNEYGMTCEGNTITMYVNGKKLKEYNDRTYVFSDGQVGFNISSLNVLPVTVEVQSFDIAEP